MALKGATYTGPRGSETVVDARVGERGGGWRRVGVSRPGIAPSADLGGSSN